MFKILPKHRPHHLTEEIYEEMQSTTLIKHTLNHRDSVILDIYSISPTMGHSVADIVGRSRVSVLIYWYPW